MPSVMSVIFCYIPRSSSADVCRLSSGKPQVAMRSVATAAVNGSYDYDLIIIGCGVGGHGAALHAVEQGMKVAVVEGHDVGGTCVNRGCVPSKALLAASGRVRDFRNEMHLKSLGIQVRHPCRVAARAAWFGCPQQPRHVPYADYGTLDVLQWALPHVRLA